MYLHHLLTHQYEKVSGAISTPETVIYHLDIVVEYYEYTLLALLSSNCVLSHSECSRN